MKMTILTEIVVASLIFTLSYSQTDIWIGQPPTLIKGPPKNLIYRSGENITLECKAKGIPAVTYEWTKDGNKLTEILRDIQRGVDGTISIQNATSMDEGFYQCVAKNQYGTALSDTTHLQRAFIEFVSQGHYIENKTVCEEKPFYIRCDEHRSFPKPTYFWEILNGTDDEDRIPFTLTKMTRIAENGDLHFGYALVNDSLHGKRYRCSVNNSYVGVQKGRTYTRLTVITLAYSGLCHIPGSTPVPTTEVTHQSSDGCGFASNQTLGLTGGSVTIQCLFYKKPEDQLQISWSRHSPPESFLPNERFTLNDFNTTLTINNITASDDGTYQCQAESGQGLGITIKVEAAPTFSYVNDVPHDVNVSEGESVTFNCNATAKPSANIGWLQNGIVLDPTKLPKRFVFSKDLKSLTIRDVCQYCDDRDEQTDLIVIQCNASNVHGYAFAQGYINVHRNNTMQNDTKICDGETDKHNIHWSRTKVGIDVFRRCPRNKRGLCSRKCLLNTTWSQTNYNGCFDKEFVELLIKVINVMGDFLKGQTVVAEDVDLTTASIKVNNLTDDDLKNQTVIDQIAIQLSAMTNTNESLSAGNLNASIIIMSRLADLRSSSTDQPSEIEIKSIVQAISNVLRSRHEEAWEQLKYADKNIAASILSTLDVYGRSLSMLHIYHRIQEDSLVLEAWSFEKSKLPLQLEFPSYSTPSVKREDWISIYVESQNSSYKSQPPLNMWGVQYETIDKYLPGKKDSDDVINSKVISFSIEGLSTNETLKRPVLITLKHNQEKRRLFRRTCVFWNFDRGDWDAAGCSVASTNKTHTICSCNHLTNFAILMSRIPVKDELLSLISIIGCSISVAALILTAIVYAVTWKHAISSQAALLMNLCIALIIAYTIFMAGADKTDSSGFTMVGCKVVAVMLHYFFLVAFFIMLAEGVDMVLYIFFVFHVRRTRETIMLVAAAWVVPMIIVGVSLGVTQLEGYGHNEACWLSIGNGLIWAFIGPVLCIIAINLVILIIILRLISQKKALLATTSKTRDEIRATIWNLSVMCPVLGLGWLFGVFSVSFDHVAFQYVFVIANSLHGLLIFIIYALFHNKKMNEKISAVYYKYIGICRKTDPNVSTKLTSSQDQSTSSTSNTQMTVAQEQSTSGAAPAYVVIATTSVPEQSIISLEPAYDTLLNNKMTSEPEQSIIAAPAFDSVANTQIQMTSEPEPKSPSATVVYRTVCWETRQIITEEQLLDIDDSDKFASTYESERDTIYSQQHDESDDEAKET